MVRVIKELERERERAESLEEEMKISKGCTKKLHNKNE